jgi:hypothetical protein
MLKNIACLDPKPDNLYFPPACRDYEALSMKQSPMVSVTAKPALTARV